MGIASRRAFRDKFERILIHKFGERQTDIYLFLKERHRRRSRNKFIICLRWQKDEEIDCIYLKSKELGIELQPMNTIDIYWRPGIYFFVKEEDYNFFRLNFKDYIGSCFSFNEMDNYTKNIKD